jgi:hypothetical protein
LERDKDTLLKSLADMTAEALDELAPEERYRIYKMMKLKATALLDGVVAPTNEVGALELAS